MISTDLGNHYQQMGFANLLLSLQSLLKKIRRGKIHGGNGAALLPDLANFFVVVCHGAFQNFYRAFVLFEQNEAEFLNVIAPRKKRRAQRDDPQIFFLQGVEQNEIGFYPAKRIFDQTYLIQHKQIVSVEEGGVHACEHENFFRDDDDDVRRAVKNFFVVGEVFAGRLIYPQPESQSFRRRVYLKSFLRGESPIRHGEEHLVRQIFFGAQLLLEKVSHECDQSFSRTRRAQHEQPLAYVVKFFVGENFSLQLREIFEAEFRGEFKNLFFFFQKNHRPTQLYLPPRFRSTKKPRLLPRLFLSLG